MEKKLISSLDDFQKLIQEKGWQIVREKDIDHGRQVVITDGFIQLPVNFFNTGKITPQGRACETKDVITEWVNLRDAGLVSSPKDEVLMPQNRISKYFVLSENIEKIREVISDLPGEILDKEVAGPADVYRIENRLDGNRVTISQYNSGTLMVQGLSTELFDNVCDVLDIHLIQTLPERASRYLAKESERNTVTSYLEQPEAENESTQWLFQNIEKEVVEFLYENDQRTLLAAAGVRNAFQRSKGNLPDYSVVVMPFAKPYEGFLMKLAVHLGLTHEDALAKRANEIEIGGWVNQIKNRMPDPKRFGEIATGLDAAWKCRHKAVHSDPFLSLSTLKLFNDAEHEIATILRAMTRAHAVFVGDGIELLPPKKKGDKGVKPEEEFKFDKAEREKIFVQLKNDGYSVSEQGDGRKNAWEIIEKPNLVVVAPNDNPNMIIVSGGNAESVCDKYRSFLDKDLDTVGLKIGVDESGKGDLFGPLVVAGVVTNPEMEILLAKRGVRDSKALSDATILELASFIKENCVVDVLVMLPHEYNVLYEQYGNLNRLLAWGHAQVICKLSKKQKVVKAISDQFGDESLVINALKAENCEIVLEQRHHAESDIAVAAASIIARAEFVLAIKEFTAKAGISIPFGSSADEVKNIGREVYRRWGKPGLERITKMHFKTIQEIMRETK